MSPLFGRRNCSTLSESIETTANMPIFPLDGASGGGYNLRFAKIHRETETADLEMYAIIADGGRQYKVEEGQTLEIDFRELEEGADFTFDRVLAVSDGENFKLGSPTVSGASVTAKVLGESKGEKIFVQKFRRRKNSKRRTGHRQKYVKVQIASIAG